MIRSSNGVCLGEEETRKDTLVLWGRAIFIPIPLKINLGFIAEHTLLTLEIVIFIT